jgi:hypothetical protein
MTFDFLFYPYLLIILTSFDAVTFFGQRVSLNNLHI